MGNSEDDLPLDCSSDKIVLVVSTESGSDADVAGSSSGNCLGTWLIDMADSCVPDRRAIPLRRAILPGRHPCSISV
jgi:hypothetical protein